MDFNLGDVPSVEDGIIDTTACINQDRECCVSQLDIKVNYYFINYI